MFSILADTTELIFTPHGAKPSSNNLGQVVVLGIGAPMPAGTEYVFMDVVISRCGFLYMALSALHPTTGTAVTVATVLDRSCPWPRHCGYLGRVL